LKNVILKKTAVKKSFCEKLMIEVIVKKRVLKKNLFEKIVIEDVARLSI
jgi:hypothetical protein